MAGFLAPVEARLAGGEGGHYLVGYELSAPGDLEPVFIVAVVDEDHALARQQHLTGD